MATGTDVWVWVGHVWSDRVKLVLDKYGDRITDVSIFCQFVNSDGSLTQTFDPELLIPYRERWPHIRFWLGYRNDGIASIFTALRNDPAARSRLVRDLGELLDKFPWVYGIDTDLEQGGGSENSVAAERIFQDVTNLAHSRGYKHAAALPPLTSTGSVGGENWVRYKQLGKILDHLAIMSYDFAWRGSAPGPTSPGFWMRNVYSWVVSQVDPKKVSWGLPLYAYFWEISKPPTNPQGWRGNSGPFYAAYGFFSGHLAIDGTFANPSGSGDFDRIGWTVFRDEDSRACWGLLECYDWVLPTGHTFQRGVQFGEFEGKSYGVRYGVPGGSPIWTIADNGPGSSEIGYGLVPREAVDYYGNLVKPKSGKYNLTVELLQRYPVAATIIDDFATSTEQLSTVYSAASGSWSFHTVPGSTYSQYRGSGRLNFNNDFGSQSLYVQARFQFPQAATFRLFCKGITAEINSSGSIRVLRGSKVLATENVGAIPVGTSAGNDAFRRVIGLRVREKSARVYYSGSETNVPRVIKVNTTPGTDPGTVGIGSTGTVWVDHMYLGDGWYYQPREAVEVTIGGQTRVVGRLPRKDISWHRTLNAFRPNKDVDEIETRLNDASISLDWEYAHWIDVPVKTNKKSFMKIVPLDHDTWIGRSFLFNGELGLIAYWTDSDTISYWRAVAGLDYGVSGIALWTVGQEDVRIWDALGGGELNEESRIVQG